MTTDVCVAWLFSLSQVRGVEALQVSTVLGASLGGVTAAEAAEVVTLRSDLALQTRVLKVSLAPLEDLPKIVVSIAEPGGVVDLSIVLVCVDGVDV